MASSNYNLQSLQLPLSIPQASSFALGPLRCVPKGHGGGYVYVFYHQVDLGLMYISLTIDAGVPYIYPWDHITKSTW